MKRNEQLTLTTRRSAALAAVRCATSTISAMIRIINLS